MNLIKLFRNKLFPPHFSFLHWIGKDFISPIKQMKNIAKEVFKNANIETVMDFGSGTLVWADYFSKELKQTVYAVDTFYETWIPPAKKNIVYYSDYKKCFRDHPKLSCIWACDVFHHIPQETYKNFIDSAVEKSNTIIIKDNDSNHKFKFFMNRVHDRIINGEKIYDVFPDKIIEFLESHLFSVKYYYMPKFWYPHFMIIACKRRNDDG